MKTQAIKLKTQAKKLKVWAKSFGRVHTNWKDDLRVNAQKALQLNILYLFDAHAVLWPFWVASFKKQACFNFYGRVAKNRSNAWFQHASTGWVATFYATFQAPHGPEKAKKLDSANHTMAFLPPVHFPSYKLLEHKKIWTIKEPDAGFFFQHLKKTQGEKELQETS